MADMNPNQQDEPVQEIRRSGILGFFQQAYTALQQGSLPAIPEEAETVENFAQDLNKLVAIDWKFVPESNSISVLIALNEPDFRLQNELNPRSLFGTGAYNQLYRAIPLPPYVHLTHTHHSADQISCPADCDVTQFMRLAFTIETNHPAYCPGVTRLIFEEISEKLKPYTERFKTLHSSKNVPTEAYDVLSQDPALYSL
jgi:hypothetical protein